MVPEKHDGSYDLIKCLLEEYKSVPIDILDYSDMNVIYFMIVVTQKSTIDHKRRIIN